jgi:uncharacterized protein (TIGR00297 family)
VIPELKDLPVALLLIAGVVFSIYAKKLTPAAAFTGLICGLLLYVAAGYPGILMLTMFFLCGTIATSWGRKKKEKLNKPGDDLRRNAAQVLANAGMATLIAVLMIIFPSYDALLMVLLSATLASAMADTLSSELGMLYGKIFYNCVSWKKDQCGLDGVISLEGTLIGAAGAAVIALMYTLTEGFSFNFLIIIIAGAAGNFSDSFMGATLERKGILSNDQVNFLSTFFAAVVAVLFFMLFSVK